MCFGWRVKPISGYVWAASKTVDHVKGVKSDGKIINSLLLPTFCLNQKFALYVQSVSQI